MQNSATLDITNNCLDAIMFGPEEVLRIIDLGSLGYYKIKQGILKQNLSKYYRFEKADTICKHFNKKKYKYTKERETISEELREKYPWLDLSSKRKYITDKEILEKYRIREIMLNGQRKEVSDWHAI